MLYRSNSPALQFPQNLKWVSFLTNSCKSEDIDAGLRESIANRLSSLMRYLGGSESLWPSCKNVGMVAALKKSQVPNISNEPQIMGRLELACLHKRQRQGPDLLLPGRTSLVTAQEWPREMREQ